MARKSFALHTEPHIAEIGDDIQLLFRPEVMGDDFLDAYATLREAQSALPTDPGDLAGVDISAIRDAGNALRRFLADFMLPDSASAFEDLALPDRVLVELFEWVMELYGGRTRPTGPSNGSATPSPRAGTRGTGTSRSRASTPTRGR